jgi:bifunctional UDP-N-acetylglucosamine pyrophosphorylase/glucosamine-1-phosphate N-acetyltransferase
VIYPDVIVDGATTIAEDCRIYPGCRIADCTLGRGVHVLDHSIAVDSRIGAGARIGPFAHLRPGSVLGRDTKVGNFVELKQARLGDGAKASHLTYLGDARVGAGANIGAGTITCNYDGHAKHETVLGAGVFVGSNSQLVAPVVVGRGAYVAAGSTVTEDVPPGALAIARSRQRNIPGWAAKRRRG